MSEELLPCPFCGGEVARDFIDDSIHRTIGCSNCGISLWMTDEQWNTRANPPRPAATVSETPETQAILDTLSIYPVELATKCAQLEQRLTAALAHCGDLASGLSDALTQRDAALAAQRKAEEERDAAIHSQEAIRRNANKDLSDLRYDFNRVAESLNEARARIAQLEQQASNPRNEG